MSIANLQAILMPLRQSTEQLVTTDAERHFLRGYLCEILYDAENYAKRGLEPDRSFWLRFARAMEDMRWMTRNTPEGEPYRRLLLFLERKGREFC